MENKRVGSKIDDATLGIQKMQRKEEEIIIISD